MTYNPVSITRRQVLGDLYHRCENLERIPVYLSDKSGEPIGHVDEALGHYADAFCFHLPEDICKNLSRSHYNYGLDFEVCGDKRVKLNCIVLVAKDNSTVAKIKLMSNSYT